MLGLDRVCGDTIDVGVPVNVTQAGPAPPVAPPPVVLPPVVPPVVQPPIVPPVTPEEPSSPSTP